MYSVRIYKRTGFNAVNAPDRPALLEQCEYVDFPAVDIITNVEIASIRIRATKAQLDWADYCCIYTAGGTDAWYYSIPAGGITPLNCDTWEIQLVPDYVLTAGGIFVVWPHVIDGIVERSHVSDDTYGRWCVEDELLQNSEPLVLEVSQLSFSNDTIDVVESSLDLGLMGRVLGAEVHISAADVNEKIAVPQAFDSMIDTRYKLDGHTAMNHRTTVFLIDNSNVRAGIERCRALGIESAVIATASIPSELVSKTEYQESISGGSTTTIGDITDSIMGVGSRIIKGLLAGISSALSGAWAPLATLSGVWSTKSTGFSFIYDSTVKNRRVLYGSLNRVGILTTAGNRLESKPEELVGGSRTAIHVKSVGDPHLNGKPYHRFEYMNGDGTNVGFWRSAVCGLPWRQIPITYHEKSGSALDRVSFQNARDVVAQERSFTLPGIIDKITGKTGSGESGVLSGLVGATGGLGSGAMLSGAASGVAGGMVGAGTMGAGTALGITAAAAILPVVLGAGFAAYSYTKATAQYELQKRQEMQQFAISQSVVSPTIDFSYDADALASFYGETVIAYRYKLSQRDLQRADKKLTMYGYKTCIPATEASISNRQYFNYLKGNVAIGGDSISRRLADGITAQLSVGQRFWHVLPSNQYYGDNPVVATPPTP